VLDTPLALWRCLFNSSALILIRYVNGRATHAQRGTLPAGGLRLADNAVTHTLSLMPRCSCAVAYDDLRTRRYHSHNNRTCFGV
jgi:hypothetical protein